jgi:hypothetical protein
MGKVLEFANVIPSSVIVGPFEFAVLCDEVSRLRAQERGGATTQLLGNSNVDLLEIVVNETSPHQVQQETLMHEVLHAVVEVAGLAHEWDDETEENTVRRISPVLLEVLRRNKPLVRYLTHG